MYVGQSGNVLNRIAAWIGSMPGKFDEAQIFPCSIAELSETEARHIREFDPPLNVVGRTQAYRVMRVAAVPWVIQRFGSGLAYLRSRNALVLGGELMQAGVLGPGPTSQLLLLPDFPAPVELHSRGAHTRGKWRRDDVIAWWLEHREAAREPAA